jgi:hypothetical protein
MDWVDAKVWNSRLNYDWDEILITRVHKRPEYFDVDVVNKRTWETWFMRMKYVIVQKRPNETTDPELLKPTTDDVSS